MSSNNVIEADVNAKSNDGETALYMASYWARLEIAEYFKQNGEKNE